MRVLLITPPLLQCNAPYAATPLLTACLRQAGIETFQADASLRLLLRLFSAAGLERVRAAILAKPGGPGPDGRRFLAEFDRYAAVIGPVVAFLQGRDPALAHRIVRGGWLPEGPRFEVMKEQETGPDGSLDWAFGSLGAGDHARYLASLMLDDLAAVVQAELDPGFGLARYEERLAAALPQLDPLLARLEAPPTLTDLMIDETARELAAEYAADFIGLTVPFPGNLYGALRLARELRHHPGAARRRPRIAIGGGYVNTELRDLTDPRLFDFADFVCLDAGPEPLLQAVRHAATARPGKSTDTTLTRTFVRQGRRVVWQDIPGARKPTRHRDLPPPTWDGLPLADYIQLSEMLNPMHALWSSVRWNRLLLAHGCHWHRCRFCDTSLDYIRRFDPAPAARAADWIEAAVGETGSRGFHFVDEAMPPALLRGLARELIRRRLQISWWGNIRFEPAFDHELAALLAESGCIALTGGLEAPCDRLLGLMAKGITVAQAARACGALADAGILTHAYLMYGLPTQTAAETVDGLERVRQLFAAGALHSAFWHRFSATVHSEVGREPEAFGVSLCPPATGGFARNAVDFIDPGAPDHAALGEGLRRATYNYMHGVGLDADVRSWFSGQRIPKPRVGKNEIRRAMAE